MDATILSSCRQIDSVTHFWMRPGAEWDLQIILIGGRSSETSEDDSDDGASKSTTKYGFLLKPSENASENLVNFNEELQCGKETH